MIAQDMPGSRLGRFAFVSVSECLRGHMTTDEYTAARRLDLPIFGRDWGLKQAHHGIDPLLGSPSLIPGVCNVDPV